MLCPRNDSLAHSALPSITHLNLVHLTSNHEIFSFLAHSALPFTKYNTSRPSSSYIKFASFFSSPFGSRSNQWKIFSIHHPLKNSERKWKKKRGFSFSLFSFSFLMNDWSLFSAFQVITHFSISFHFLISFYFISNPQILNR